MRASDAFMNGTETDARITRVAMGLRLSIAPALVSRVAVGLVAEGSTSHPRGGKSYPSHEVMGHRDQQQSRDNVGVYAQQKQKDPKEVKHHRV